MRARLVALLLFSGVAHAAALDFELSDGGRFVRLSELPARTTVVNFWRSDCPPCLREMPLLGDFARRDKARVVAVAVQRPAETLAAPQAVLDAIAPPVLALNGPGEPRGLLARFGNPVGALPYTVVLDARRVPCARRVGEIDTVWLEAALLRCR
jgi:thiol-disulfide isomerase/thioredoxin